MHQVERNRRSPGILDLTKPVSWQDALLGVRMPSCAAIRSTRLRGLSIVELEQATESLTTFHRAGSDVRRLRRDDFVAETLVRPFFMIVTCKFCDRCPE